MKKSYESFNTPGEDLSEKNKEIGRAALDASEEAKTDLKYWAREYCNIEKTFPSEKIGHNLKEYEIWEEDASEAFYKTMEAESKVTFDSVYDKDAAERLPAVDGEKSIEAYAGHFYDERNGALLDAIRSSDREEAEKDRDTIGDLHTLVSEYLGAAGDNALERRNVEQYHRNRRAAHDEVINRINAINDLAKKYGVKALTFRNFIINDQYNKHLDWSGETNARGEYDRSSVEGYIKAAFAEDFREAESGNGDKYYDPNKSLVSQFHQRD